MIQTISWLPIAITILSQIPSFDYFFLKKNWYTITRCFVAINTPQGSGLTWKPFLQHMKNVAVFYLWLCNFFRLTSISSGGAPFSFLSLRWVENIIRCLFICYSHTVYYCYHGKVYCFQWPCSRYKDQKNPCYLCRYKIWADTLQDHHEEARANYSFESLTVLLLPQNRDTSGRKLHDVLVMDEVSAGIKCILYI